MSRPDDEQGPAFPSGGGEPPPTAEPDEAPSPWPQRLYENIWLWAGAAILFWFLSYVVWGVVDLLVLQGG